MGTQIIERMAVEVEGQGDPLVMLHGLGGTSNTFTPQMPVFAAHFRVVRPDLPGSGRSPSGGDTLSIQLYVDHIIRMAEVLGIERAHFAGHSMGTLICQHIAAQRPRLVRSLALFGPLLAPTDAARQGLRQRAEEARSGGMASIADAIVRTATSSDTQTNQPVTVALIREMLMRQDAEGYARSCEALAGARAVETSLLKCPTSLLTGDEDTIAPPSIARLLAERVAGAQVYVSNRCGHWITFERAAEVNTTLHRIYFNIHFNRT